MTIIKTNRTWQVFGSNRTGYIIFYCWLHTTLLLPIYYWKGKSRVILCSPNEGLGTPLPRKAPPQTGGQACRPVLQGRLWLMWLTCDDSATSSHFLQTTKSGPQSLPDCPKKGNVLMSESLQGTIHNWKTKYDPCLYNLISGKFLNCCSLNFYIFIS